MGTTAAEKTGSARGGERAEAGSCRGSAARRACAGGALPEGAAHCGHRRLFGAGGAFDWFRGTERPESAAKSGATGRPVITVPAVPESPAKDTAPPVAPGSPGQTFNYGSGSVDTGPGSGSSLREDYDDPEGLYEDGDYDDLDEAWDEWEEGW